MTLESQLTKAHYYQGNELRLPFPVLRPEHVHLILVDLATGEEDPVESGYTVTGCGTDSVDVHFPIPAGKKLTVFRELPLTQEMDLENGTAFDGEVIETNFDILAMQVQQVAEEVERSVKISVTSEEDAPTAEDIYAQVDRIADRAEVAVERAEEAVEKAEDAAERAEDALEKIEDAATIATGVENLYDLWTTDEAIPAGGTLTLPVGYFPGRNMLQMTWNGWPCLPAGNSSPPDTFQFREIGEQEHLSTEVAILFDAPAGSLWSAWAVASNVSREIRELTESASIASETAAHAAEEAHAAKKDVLQTIGDAAEIAAEQAAIVAVESVREGLSAYTDAARAAQEAAETARDGAGEKLAAVLEAVANMGEAETSLNTAREATEAATDAAATIVSDVTAARDAARESAENARLAAETAAQDAAAAAVDAAVTNLESSMAEKVNAAQTAQTAAENSALAAAGAFTEARQAADEAAGYAGAAKARTVFHSPRDTRGETIPAWQNFTVPSYILGENMLSVFIDGLPCVCGGDPEIHQFFEIGNQGKVSTTIAFLDDISPSHDILVIA